MKTNSIVPTIILLATHTPPHTAEQSSRLLPATSQHGHSCHRAPLGPMVIYLFSVKTFAFFFRCSSFDKKGGVGLFYNCCSLTSPYSTRGHIKVGDIYILYIFTKHKLTLSSTTYMYRDICQCRIVQKPMLLNYLFTHKGKVKMKLSLCLIN
jgi:hypothetical protein